MVGVCGLFSLKGPNKGGVPLGLKKKFFNFLVVKSTSITNTVRLMKKF